MEILRYVHKKCETILRLSFMNLNRIKGAISKAGYCLRASSIRLYWFEGDPRE